MPIAQALPIPEAAMMEFFEWLEHSGFAMWVKDPETLFGYDLYLSSHAVGMAILVGLSSAVALRILGFAAGVPLGPMAKFFPLMFVGFWINALSGLVLFLIYPVKPVTNPGFYLKIGLIVAAVVCIRRIRREVFGDPASLGTAPVPLTGKRLAAALLFIWMGVITAGRLMAYRGAGGVEWKTSLAMAILVPASVTVGWLGYRLLRLNERAQAGLLAPPAQHSRN